MTAFVLAQNPSRYLTAALQRCPILLVCNPASLNCPDSHRFATQITQFFPVQIPVQKNLRFSERHARIIKHA